MNTLRVEKLDVEQKEMATSIVGVDLAQANFVASCKERVKRFKNDDTGIDAMLKWAEERSVGEQLIVCFESTGAISRPFTMEMMKRDVTHVCLFPPAVKDYAKCLGKQVKTDKQDALTIQKYAEHLRSEGALRTESYVTPTILRLQEIESTVEYFKEQIRRTKNSLKAKTIEPFCAQALTELLAELEAQKEKLIALSMEIIRGDEELNGRYEMYLQQQGVGEETARYMVVYMPELGHVSSSQISALVGLCPIEQSSGKMDMKRHIRGGRKGVRCMLYSAAVSIYRCKSGEIKQFQDRLREAGKASKVVIVATAHKILRVLNGKTKKFYAGIPIYP